LKIRAILKSALLIGNFVLMLFFTSFKTNAAIINVSSIAALQTASNTALPGDIIVLANNTYLNSTLNITTSNITVRAATPGGVILNGTNSITISGNNITFSGFQFLSGSISGNVISVTGNYALLTQLNFNGYSAQKYINISGQYDEVSYCNFENKPTSAPIGNLVHIAPNGTVPNYAKIRYCSFKNMSGAGGDAGNECIRIANGAQSTFLCRTIVEYCYFENTGNGDSEAISVKSRENVLRYNTFRNNQNAMMVFRNGNDNVAYGNFFIGAGGIRVKEANNIYCYNNYFENAGVGGTMNAVSYVYVSPNLNNINFFHNTFVECGLIDLATGATNNTWANNIFKKSSGNIFSGSSAGITFSGNIYQGNLGISIPSGMTNSDPQLTINSKNYFGLSSLSPAINTASATYPAILDIANVDDDPSLLLDISGQPRPVLKSEKDIGCDEFTTGNTTNHPLVLAEVGPSFLGGPGGVVKQNQTITFPTLASKIFGDADFSAGATSTSGLAVSYTSANLAVATIVNGNIRIVGAGSSIITAKQPGDATFNAASDVSQTLVVAKANQSITFNALPEKSVGNADFAPGATSTSGLTISYTSSNLSVATIVNGNIRVVGAGVATITASQPGNASYNAASTVSQTLVVAKGNQTITFNTLPAKRVGDADFAAGATSTSGLAITYTSSNLSVATIVNGNIRVVAAGVTTITASQLGSANYNAAVAVNQTLTVTAAPVVYTYSPRTTTVLAGTSTSAFGNLATNNSSYYVANSTTSGTRRTDWYGSTTISQAPSSVSKLTINYDGRNSASKTQILYLYNWVTALWVQIDSRTVSTTDVLINNVQNSPINYVSSTGEIRLRVFSSGGTRNYTASGDWMSFSIETSNGLRPMAMPTGSLPEKQEPDFSIYPNPASNYVLIHYILDKEEVVELSLLNLKGQFVKKFMNNQNQAIGNYKEYFDISDLKAGIYLIKLSTSSYSKTVKLVVSK
jgi:hypothetical protein